MQFSTRTTYGLRAMSYLARNWNKGNVSLAKISKDESISLAYLERIFSGLKKAGLVKSEKGVKGGYFLPVSPDKINIYDVIKVLEGDIKLFHCLKEDGSMSCREGVACGAVKALSRVQGAIYSTLKGMKLNDIK